MSIGTLWRKNIIRNFFLQIIFGHWAKNTGLLSEISQWGCSNCSLLFQRNIWWKNVCLKKIYYFLKSILTLEQKLCTVFSETFRWGCENCIPRVHWDFLKKNSLRKKNFSIIFGKWGENFSAFWHNFFGRIVKTAFYLFMRLFWGNRFFSSLWDNREIVWPSEKLFVRLVKTSSCLSGELFPEINFVKGKNFFYPRPKKFRFSEKNFSAGYQNCPLRFHRTQLKK